MTDGHRRAKEADGQCGNDEHHYICDHNDDDNKEIAILSIRKSFDYNIIYPQYNQNLEQDKIKIWQTYA